jgi:hypothetical protein
MNRLPAVLQKEIWEYVHGDRAFWKTQYELVLESLENACDFRHKRVISRSHYAEWNHCVLDSQSINPGRGKLIREFRRYLSSIDVPVTPDTSEEWKIHVDMWRQWLDSFTEV